MSIKPYIDLAQTSSVGGSFACGGAVFSARRRDRRVVGVMGCGAGVGACGDVEATALVEMVLESLFSGVALSVAAGWVVRSFGLGSGFVVVDLDEVSGEFDILEYRSSGGPRRLEVRVVGERVAMISESELSLSGFGGGSCPGARIMRGTLNQGDMIVLGSWIKQGAGAEMALGEMLCGCADMAGRLNIMPDLILQDSLTGLALELPFELSKEAQVLLAAMHRRAPRRLLFCSGPPFNDSNDDKLCQVVDSWQGTKLISGGTTAQIISRGLGREINVNLKRDISGLPPTSSMPGIDLITEGVLTLSRLDSLLQNTQTTSLNGQGIDYQVAQMLLRHDEIEFIVGTRINVVHQDPNLPMELELRRNVIKRIANILQTKFFKRVKVTYI